MPRSLTIVARSFQISGSAMILIWRPLIIVPLLKIPSRSFNRVGEGDPIWSRFPDDFTKYHRRTTCHKSEQADRNTEEDYWMKGDLEPSGGLWQR